MRLVASPVGSVSWIRATASRPRWCRSKARAAVSNSERRVSRAMAARVRPVWASSRKRRSSRSVTSAGTPCGTLNDVPAVGNTSRMRDHSSMRRAPSMITPMTGRSTEMPGGCGQLAVLELELPFRPQEEVVDRLPHLELQRAAEVGFGHRAVADQDHADEPAFLLLAEQGLEQLLLGDQRVADQELAEGLPRVVGPRGVDDPVLEGDALLDGAPVDLEGARLPPPRDPLQDLGEVHGAQVTGEAHGRAPARALRPYPRRCPRTGSRASSRARGSARGSG